MFSFEYKPDDYSDVGQAEILAKVFHDSLAFSDATLFLNYDGRIWNESESGAQALAQELTKRQLKEATEALEQTSRELEPSGASLSRRFLQVF